MFRKIVCYLAELFRQIVCYLAELFRQIAFRFYLPPNPCDDVIYIQDNCENVWATSKLRTEESWLGSITSGIKDNNISFIRGFPAWNINDSYFIKWQRPSKPPTNMFFFVSFCIRFFKLYSEKTTCYILPLNWKPCLIRLLNFLIDQNYAKIDFVC